MPEVARLVDLSNEGKEEEAAELLLSYDRPIGQRVRWWEWVLEADQ